MNKQQLATGALLALAAVAAQAASFDLTGGQFSANVDKTASTEFSDVYNFSFTGTSGFISGSLAEYKLSNAIDIDWGDVPAMAIHAGWDGTGAVLASFADPMVPVGSFSIQDLMVPNQFSITISGRAIGTGLAAFQPGVRGSYDLSIAAQPVPEPESYALMLAGLGVIGFLGVRRRADR
jgi:PEP-CTERM motif